MSQRRGGVLIPLIALIASFMAVLVLGALFATSSSGDSVPTPTPTTPTPTTSGGGTATVQISVDDLTSDTEVWEAFPGVRLTVNPADKQGGVEICVNLPADWTISSGNPRWLSPKGANRFCGQRDRIQKDMPFNLQLERQK